MPSFVLCLSSGPVPIEVHVDTTPALVPVPTDAALGADLVAGTGEEAIAVPPCQIVVDTLATGYMFSASTACWFGILREPLKKKSL